MRLDERIRLASLAYEQAIADARSRPTPASWRRLLAAARNLNAARKERQRAAAPLLPSST
jgi:hypothetical protein